MNFEKWDTDLIANDEEQIRSKVFWFCIGVMGGMLLLGALLHFGFLVQHS